MKRNVLLAVIVISMLSLTGCGRGLPATGATEESASVSDSDMGLSENSLTADETEKDHTVPPESQCSTEDEPRLERSTESGAEEDPGLEDGVTESATVPEKVPQLPETGREIGDFVPEGWELLDSVELDFNEDGKADYVGVLQTGYEGSPRILFAIASGATDGYHLDFQNINLIRAGNEGGVYGDPYQPLTAEGTSFTTCAYGGSAWRWSEEFTYTYRDGGWWLTSSEDIYGYVFGYTTSYSKNDWENGVGIRKKRSSEFDDMEGKDDTAEYDVVYELALDEALTLEQAGWRYAAAPNRVTDREVTDIVLGAEVDISTDLVRLPDKMYADYCDEDCMLYTFSDEDNAFYYIAMYRWRDKVLSVLAKEDTAIDDLVYYKGKIYYTTETRENVTYKMVQDGGETAQREETVGIRLNRIDPDGTHKEIIFDYHYPKAGQGIMEDWIPYLAFIYEISGDEIVLEVYIGEEPHLFYRMNTDGSGLREIGHMPKEV